MKKKILEIKKQALEIPLIKNILIMGSGTGIAQLLPIISAPIVTRLYLPEHFGTYALFYSLSTILFGVAALDYHNIIIVGETQRKSFLGLLLSLFVAAILCVLFLFFFIFLPYPLFKSMIGDQILPFLKIIPLTVFINVCSTLLYNWFLREGEYKFLSKNKIILAICSVILQICIGLLQMGTIGFIIANLMATSTAVVLMFIRFNRKYKFLYSLFSFKEMKIIAIEYKKFSLVSVWANSLNIFTLQIPDLLINKFFGAYVLGQYSLAQRMITMPSYFMASAIQEVFKQTAAQENRDTGNCKESYIRTLKISTIMAIVLLLASLTFIPPLFILIFGNKWTDAGLYVRVMCLLFAVRFIAPSLSFVFYIKNKQQIDFLWQAGLFILSITILYGGYYALGITNPLYLLLTYSCILSIWYFINLWLTYSLVFLKDK